MTAMSDVTVLLLTFFMLTSTFLQKEPATVITPTSVSEIKVPMSDLVTVLVSGAELNSDGSINRNVEGKVFIGIQVMKTQYSQVRTYAEIFCLRLKSCITKDTPTQK